MSNALTKVWVGCLASYNAGVNFGCWLEMGDYDEADAFKEAVAKMLRTSSKENERLHYSGWVAEEYHVCDYEEFGPFKVDRYESLDDIYSKARMVLDEDEEDVLTAAAEAFGANYLYEGLKGDDDWLNNRFIGCGKEDGDMASELYEYEVGTCGVFANCIDWVGFEADLEFVKVRYNGMNYFFDNC